MATPLQSDNFAMNRTRMTRQALKDFKTAILHQGGPAPAVGGVVKPFKPGGYTDSGSDLGYALQRAGRTVITPNPHPDPADDKSWTFPDTVQGIREAIKLGANTLYANTVLHSQHPLVTMNHELKGIRMVGQSPKLTERWDDKANTNLWLASQEGLESAFPKSRVVYKNDMENLSLEEDGIGWPRILKPIRGRGSHGVAVIEDEKGFQDHIKTLFAESDAVLVEEYCNGEEITVTVMPPGEYTGVGKQETHWSLPVVRRIGHKNGIAPYSGLIPVTANSKVVPEEETSQDSAYKIVQDRCAIIGAHCKAFGPMRVDARRRSGSEGDFVIFDVNSKPNVTGPGRPGRDEQTALTGMAAEAIGWNYETFVENILAQAQLVEDVNEA